MRSLLAPEIQIVWNILLVINKIFNKVITSEIEWFSFLIILT